jgi:AGZA family xanthine/uracil permease-like MFS transporter
MTPFKPKLWAPGDWNALFGFGANILVNLLTLTALLRFVLKMPDDLVFGRILPAVGLMLFLSTVYYAWLAYRLARQTGRTDVCALPSGISVPHMFVVTFVIMLPITLRTGDPVKGWEAGLTWVFIQSFVLIGGGFIAPWIRKITPRAALLGTLAGVSVTFISMRPALEMFMTPIIGITCFAIILLSWFGGVRYRGVPAGLVAIAVGTVVAWGSTALGLNYGGLSLQGLADSVSNFGFQVPLPAFGHVFSGFEFLGVLLVTAIPFGIYDLVEAIDNVESAAVAGDNFPTTRVLTADGVVSLIGCLMGNPFINAVYIGHPGWKAMGGRIGYSAATGGMVILLCWFGVISVILALVPVVAIVPILLYIAMLIGSQAFQETPRSHAPAIILSLAPHMANWAITLIHGALAAAGSGVATLSPAQMEELVGRMRNEGVLYHGLHVLGGGSILGGLVLGAIGVCVIDRKFGKAAGFALAGAAFTFFGFMHGEQIGIAQSPVVALSYFVISGIFLCCSRFAVVAPKAAEMMEAHDFEQTQSASA